MSKNSCVPLYKLKKKYVRNGKTTLSILIFLFKLLFTTMRRRPSRGLFIEMLVYNVFIQYVARKNYQRQLQVKPISQKKENQ